MHSQDWSFCLECMCVARNGVLVWSARAYPGLEFVSGWPKLEFQWEAKTRVLVWNGWTRLEFLSGMVGQDWSSSGLRWKARPEVFSWNSWPSQAYVGDYLWFSVYNLLSGDTQCPKAVKCLSFNHKACGFPIFVYKRCGIPYSITIASEFLYSITVSVEFLYSITRHVKFLLSFAVD